MSKALTDPSIVTLLDSSVQSLSYRRVAPDNVDRETRSIGSLDQYRKRRRDIVPLRMSRL